MPALIPCGNIPVQKIWHKSGRAARIGLPGPIDRRRQTVGLMGGSFNPAHEGHRHLALLALHPPFRVDHGGGLPGGIYALEGLAAYLSHDAGCGVRPAFLFFKGVVELGGAAVRKGPAEIRIGAGAGP